MLKSILLLTSILFISSFTLPELRDELDQVVQQANVNVGVEVYSLTHQKMVYQNNEEHFFVPASCLKLFTAAAALGILGTDYRFQTKVFLDDRGNLYLKGSGDPLLSVNDLESLAFQMRVNGVQEIKGDLIADVSDFDGIAQGPGWMWDEPAEYWAAPVDALVVNHSCLNLWVSPAAISGQAPEIFPYPQTNYVQIYNSADTVDKDGKLSVESKGRDRVELEGGIAKGSPAKLLRVALNNPQIYAASVFRDLMIRHGIAFQGKIRSDETPKDAKLVASHDSIPLSEIVSETLKDSDNLAANALFKKIGQQRLGKPGSYQKGGQVLKEYLAGQVGIDPGQIILLDGSGESRYNLVSPHQFVTLLTWMQEQFAFAPEFMAALPISGIDGNLSNRMRTAKMKGKVRAKSGSMTGISGLSGYLVTEQGEQLAFSILVNGFVKPPKDIRNFVEDKICTILTGLQRQ